MVYYHYLHKYTMTVDDYNWVFPRTKTLIEQSVLDISIVCDNFMYMILVGFNYRYLFCFIRWSLT